LKDSSASLAIEKRTALRAYNAVWSGVQNQLEGWTIGFLDPRPKIVVGMLTFGTSPPAME